MRRKRETPIVTEASQECIEMEIDGNMMWLVYIYTDKAREEEKGWVYGTADGPGAPFSG
jgi:hypothetical protein